MDGMQDEVVKNAKGFYIKEKSCETWNNKKT